MKRYLKVLGLTAVAALAISAVGASAAHALNFTTDEGYPATFSGSNTAGNEVFTTEAGKVECNSSFHGELEEKGETVSAHPEYSECEAFGFLEATVNTEECDYVFNNAEEAETDVYKLTVDVACPTGQSIKIVAASCAAEVGSQTGLEHVKFVVDTPTEKEAEEGKKNVLTVTATASNIVYTVTKDGLFCPFNGKGEKEDGTYDTEGAATKITSAKNVHLG